MTQRDNNAAAARRIAEHYRNNRKAAFADLDASAATEVTYCELHLYQRAGDAKDTRWNVAFYYAGDAKPSFTLVIEPGTDADKVSQRIFEQLQSGPRATDN